MSNPQDILEAQLHDQSPYFDSERPQSELQIDSETYKKYKNDEQILKEETSNSQRMPLSTFYKQQEEQQVANIFQGINEFDSQIQQFESRKLQRCVYNTCKGKVQSSNQEGNTNNHQKPQRRKQIKNPTKKKKSLQQNHRAKKLQTNHFAKKTCRGYMKGSTDDRDYFIEFLFEKQQDCEKHIIERDQTGELEIIYINCDKFSKGLLLDFLQYGQNDNIRGMHVFLEKWIKQQKVLREENQKCLDSVIKELVDKGVEFQY